MCDKKIDRPFPEFVPSGIKFNTPKCVPPAFIKVDHNGKLYVEEGDECHQKRHYLTDKNCDVCLKIGTITSLPSGSIPTFNIRKVNCCNYVDVGLPQPTGTLIQYSTGNPVSISGSIIAGQAGTVSSVGFGNAITFPTLGGIITSPPDASNQFQVSGGIVSWCSDKGYKVKRVVVTWVTTTPLSIGTGTATLVARVFKASGTSSTYTPLDATGANELVIASGLANGASGSYSVAINVNNLTITLDNKLTFIVFLVANQDQTSIPTISGTVAGAMNIL